MLLKDIPQDSKTGIKYARATVECDEKISPKCRGMYTITRANFQLTRERNGRDICLFCSRRLKFSGRSNPNCQHKDVDDGFFHNIDTEGKAYLLGWIASDGTVRPDGIEIAVHQKDHQIIPIWNAAAGTSCSDKPHRGFVYWKLCSQQISRDVCHHLGIAPGKKSKIFRIPSLSSESLTWAFIRGWFDGDGSVTDPQKWNRELFPTPIASIASSNRKMLEWVKEFSGIPSDRLGSNAESIEWTSNNALDFLSKLYDNAEFVLPRKKILYDQWKSWVPGLRGPSGKKFPEFRCVRTQKIAVLPEKTRASDAGYDLTAISLIERIGNVEFYDTGVKIQPSYGWWFALAARSSLAKKGYILANCFGVIDRTYTGTVKIPLIKIDTSNPEILTLPCKVAQLVPMPAVHMGSVIEVETLSDTHRGEGGFGSTGR